MKRSELRQPYPAHATTVNAWRSFPQPKLQVSVAPSFWSVLWKMSVTGIVIAIVVGGLLTIVNEAFNAATR